MTVNAEPLPWDNGRKRGIFSVQTVIAEKYSYAKNIRAALEMKGESFTSHMEKANGYFESDNYIVTWCFGHLFGLQDMDAYLGYHEENGKKHGWDMADLPFAPKDNRFVFVLKKDTTGGVKKQFACISRCVERADSVIAAGDADREGQLIVDLVLRQMGNSRPVYRLWVNDQTPATIAKGLDEMKPDSYYANVRDEGLTRTYMDWLYGINLTRYASIKAHQLMRVGRVIVPIVQEIVARDRAIESFVPEDYIQCISEKEYGGVPLKLKSKKTFQPDDDAADRLCTSYNEAGGTVTEVTRKNARVAPPRLFSLGSLQSAIGKQMDMKTVLKNVQELYEAGLVSYPRTGAEYLFSSEKEKVAGIVSRYEGCEMKDGAGIFNDKKNADKSHSAIIPTGKEPSGLTDSQKLVYSTILNRFRAVFCAEDRVVDRTSVTIDVCGEEFRITGDVLVSEGWGRFDEARTNEKAIPSFTQGQHIDVDFRKHKAVTSPPKHHTIKTLNAFMENPYDREEKTDVQLGTDATRAGIIDNAIRTGYIVLKKDTYYAGENGIRLVDTIEKLRLGIDKNQSLMFAQMLVSVRDGEKTVDDAISETNRTIAEVMERSGSTEIAPARKEHEIVGKCPLCGSPVAELKTRKGTFWICTSHRRDDPESCGFIMGEKARRYDDVISITSARMKKLLAGGTIPAKLTSKSGSRYDANVRLVANGRYADLEPVFDSGSEELCKCPKCGGSIIENRVAYSCSNKSCGCVLFKQDRFLESRGAKMTKKIARELFTKGQSTVSCKSKAGKDYRLIVKADFSGKYVSYTSEFPPRRG